MKVRIKRHWYSTLPSIEVEIGAEFEGKTMGVRLGAAVKVAFKSDADLRGAVLRGAVLSGADLSGAVLSGADLSGAILRGAVLSGADLSGADLRGAVLSGAVLSGAVLSGADLSGADLSGADLRGAALSGADLRGAVKFEDIPAIPGLDAKILEAVSQEGCKLDMSDWHKCETTHCRAGWAIVMAGEVGKKLEDAVGPATAGALIYARATPDAPIPNFYCSNDEAMADLRERAAKSA